MRGRDYAGMSFGRWTFVCRDHYNGTRWLWLVRCDCGTERVHPKPDKIVAGKIKSCGCGPRGHGDNTGYRKWGLDELNSQPTYRSWAQMLCRCRNPEHDKFEYYGGTGITVCERWNDFGAFLADMGERPPGTSIDRYPDPYGNYEPGNCRWATPKEQANNKRPWGTVAAKKFPKKIGASLP